MSQGPRCILVYMYTNQQAMRQPIFPSPGDTLMMVVNETDCIKEFRSRPLFDFFKQKAWKIGMFLHCAATSWFIDGLAKTLKHRTFHTSLALNSEFSYTIL